jgi:hypothetical protein
MGMTSFVSVPPPQLLDRVFRIMLNKNPNMEQGGTSRLVIRPPQVERLGTRRSAFVNFSTICKQYVVSGAFPMF